MKNDVINLITIASSQDEDGFPIDSEVSFKVFADIKSTTRSEYYAANAIGIKVQLVATINYDDYKQAIRNKVRPSKVEYDGIYYKIQRTFRKPEENDIELVLTEVE